MFCEYFSVQDKEIYNKYFILIIIIFQSLTFLALTKTKHMKLVKYDNIWNQALTTQHCAFRKLKATCQVQ